MKLDLKSHLEYKEEIPILTPDQLLFSKISGFESNIVLYKEAQYLNNITCTIENLSAITSTIEQLGIDDSMISLLGNEITSPAFLEKDKETTIDELNVTMEKLQVQAKAQETKTLAVLIDFFKKKNTYVSELYDSVQIELKRVKKLKRKKVRYKDTKAIHILPFGNSDKANKENQDNLEKQNELCKVLNSLFNAYYSKSPINDTTIYGLELFMSYKTFKDIFRWNFREVRANDKLLHPKDVTAIILYATSGASLHAGWLNAVKSIEDINEAAILSQPDSKYKVAAVLKQMVTFVTLLSEHHTTNLENYLGVLKNLTE